jgi:restriction system protein
MKKRKGEEFSKFILPVIEVLKDIGGSGTSREVTDAVIEKLDISEDELAATLKNGSSKIRNQIAWARMYLVNIGIIV